MKKKILKISLSILSFLLLIVIINISPTLQLKTKNMNLMKGQYVDVYYEKEKAAALDVYNLSEKRAEQLLELLEIKGNEKINIYIYDSQAKFQTKKHGLYTLLLGLHWYIGDNRGTDVLLTSPANSGKAHNYNSVKNAVLHEMVHAYITIINPNVKLWLTEGVALYLSNGAPFSRDRLKKITLPSNRDINTESSIKFAKIGGYELAHVYIEYLDKKYGWEKVLELIKTEDYIKIYGKPQEEISKEWIDYLRTYEK